MRGRLIALGVLAALIAARAAVTQPTAYCSLPAGPASPSWAFHAGAPIHSANGAYIHGHGTVSGATASGQICQVTRVAGGSDRQLIMSPTHAPVSIRHAVPVGGELGNEMRMQVRVSSSTDHRCKKGAHATLTLFASYSGPRLDTIKLAFTGSCHRDSHSYRGPAVIALVPG